MNQQTYPEGLLSRYYLLLNSISINPSKIILTSKAVELRLRHPFNLAGSSRTVTPSVLVQFEYDGVRAYGEAALPPYLGETAEAALSFIAQIKFSTMGTSSSLTGLITQVDSLGHGHTAAKASIDMALHDLAAKLTQKPLHQIWQLNPSAVPQSSFTIGIDEPDIVRQKVREAGNQALLKVKLGRANDRELIGAIRTESQSPLMVDANQGWTDKFEALDKICWLKEQGVVLVEQPMPVGQLNDTAWLTAHSPLPVFADESIQRFCDLERISGAFSGINIKLMKCTGLFEAHRLIAAARHQNLSVMIGCMTETSCGISAAAQLAPLADWTDLDGNLLITNDYFEGSKIENGKISLNSLPGTGAKPVGAIF
ncbi:MAG: dipeptide epimerase [Mangrovibacterium sp.]